ncbi:MAG TPA: acetylglutamate kinase [Lachnoclostridium phytofermentans]|uniref:Acetylglutamate kinase n=1 Tax=Lachnoclostridium phytofermentans TaxID=66219 RepID=A0A3D2XAQ9_9FIRM|nr:acetylglutamate kinase [Lachnoclostridium sp.]HCL04066.1 acetylglutamate kinase [Lachnoclostridium phytofermentans]
MECMNYEYTRRQLDLSNELRNLWEQHVLWTRSFIISTAASLGDLEPVTKRLMRNPTDFGNLFRLFYGRQIALEFEDLFTQHLQIAGDLVNAAKKGDTAAADEARRKWYENADEIVSFLAEINPYWDVEDWRDFFYSHLQMTEQEAALRLGGKYAEDVAIFDEIEAEALKMADEMFEGLIKQFYVC